jgi:hypothetical protein
MLTQREKNWLTHFSFFTFLRLLCVHLLTNKLFVDKFLHGVMFFFIHLQ